MISWFLPSPPPSHPPPLALFKVDLFFFCLKCKGDPYFCVKTSKIHFFARNRISSPVFLHQPLRMKAPFLLPAAGLSTDLSAFIMEVKGKTIPG